MPTSYFTAPPQFTPISHRTLNLRSVCFQLNGTNTTQKKMQVVLYGYNGSSICVADLTFTNDQLSPRMLLIRHSISRLLPLWQCKKKKKKTMNFSLFCNCLSCNPNIPTLPTNIVLQTFLNYAALLPNSTTVGSSFIGS